MNYPVSPSWSGQVASHTNYVAIADNKTLSDSNPEYARLREESANPTLQFTLSDLRRFIVEGTGIDGFGKLELGLAKYLRSAACPPAIIGYIQDPHSDYYPWEAGTQWNQDAVALSLILALEPEGFSLRVWKESVRGGKL